LIASPAYASRVHRVSASGQTHRTHTYAHRTAYTHRTHRRRRESHRLRGQQAIQPERVTQIQEALIRAHYLSGPANGEWDDTTVAAMKKYQGDHGWQTKLMPDSRALVKLGLGPDYSNAINADSASFTPPPSVGSIPPEQAEGFAQASGVGQ
jgi:peptidoglycan hydrolase-like protein with peptidoglycan-binding domain